MAASKLSNMMMFMPNTCIRRTSEAKGRVPCVEDHYQV